MKVQVQSLGQDDPMKEQMATHSSILAWEIPQRKEPGRLWSMGLRRVRYVSATKQQQHVKLLFPRVRTVEKGEHPPSLLFPILVFPFLPPVPTYPL